MDFLLESIGFPPGSDLDALARRVRERGLRQPGPGKADPTASDDRPHTPRLTLAGGLEVQLDEPRGPTDGAWRACLTPGFVAAPTHRVRVRRAGPQPGGGAWISGALEPLAWSAADGSVEDSLDARRLRAGTHLRTHATAGCGLRACLRDAVRPPRPGRLASYALAGFAIDVSELGRTTRRRRGLPSGGWFGPCRDPYAPRTVVELELEVEAVSVLENPLSGEPVDLIEVRLPTGRLPLFASRWQLAEDRLPRPEPGMHVRGAFWIVARDARLG